VLTCPSLITYIARQAWHSPSSWRFLNAGIPGAIMPGQNYTFKCY
jgi:hypothetical protein